MYVLCATVFSVNKDVCVCWVGKVVRSAESVKVRGAKDTESDAKGVERLTNGKEPRWIRLWPWSWSCYTGWSYGWSDKFNHVPTNGSKV